MTGDLADFVSRLTNVLPARWFSGQSPNLNAILTCIATPWVWLYNLIGYVSAQTRTGTATDNWLDLVSLDFFGYDLPRQSGETDPSFRARIKNHLLQGAATRVAVANGLAGLVGTEPRIFEPTRCLDTGGYGDAGQTAGTGLAYGQAGGWGNLSLPLQFFVSVERPPVPGVGMIAGYNTSAGGYGTGTSAYVDLALLTGYVTDADIQQTVTKMLPINATAWLQIN